MKLIVPTNWDINLINKLKNFNVSEMYGKLDVDVIGGGRPSCALSAVNKKNVAQQIKLIHENGMKFSYLLNSACMGNKEWTKKGRKKIIQLLDWISKIGADSVVITIPYILDIIKQKYPNLTPVVSCFANVNSVEKAKFWESSGAKVITLSHWELNRSFKLLKEIRKNVSCELQLIVNDFCISDCPLFEYHKNLISHASQEGNHKNPFIDYCRLSCRYRMISDPQNIIRGTWIRPEDLQLYEEYGIDRFKIVDRVMHSDAIETIVKAYHERGYNGNLYDLFCSNSKTKKLNEKSNIMHKLKYFFHPFKINILKLLEMKKLTRDLDIYIDNKKLEGFINKFIDEDCRYKSCSVCGYCKKKSEDVITMNNDYRNEMINTYKKNFEGITGDNLFHY